MFREKYIYETPDKITTYITKDEECTKQALGCSQIRIVLNVSLLPFWLLCAFLENLGFAQALQTNIALTCLPHITTVLLFLQLLLSYNASIKQTITSVIDDRFNFYLASIQHNPFTWLVFNDISWYAEIKFVNVNLLCPNTTQSFYLTNIFNSLDNFLTVNPSLSWKLNYDKKIFICIRFHL